VNRFVRRAVVAGAIVTSLLLATPVIASAKDITYPIATTVQQYRSEMQDYLSALRAYNHAVAIIDKNFDTAIAQAKSTETKGLQLAGSAAQKDVVIANYNAAKNLAVTVWQSAIADLGPAPVAPAPFHATGTSTTTTTTPTHTLTGGLSLKISL
jgi:prephenate dehydratase